MSPPPDLPQELRSNWEEAFAHPDGRAMPTGRNVACDICLTDYTDSRATGGFIFGSKAICPKCSSDTAKSIARFHEEKFISAICPEGQPFADFIRNQRGSDPSVKVSRSGGFGL